MKQLTNILLILLIILGCFLYFKPSDSIIQPTERIHTIENNILHTDSIIKNTETRIVDLNNSSSELDLKISDLLDSIRSQKDTVLLIQYQDSTIVMQGKQIDTLKTIITHKDTIIANERLKLDFKDEIITIERDNSKKLKRQRNIMIGVVSVIGGIQLFKK